MFRSNVFCSPIQGRLLKDGVPIKSAEVKRQILGNGLPDSGYFDSSVTDSDGKFQLPIVESRSFFKPGFLGAVPVVAIKVNVEVNREVYTLIFKNKMNFDLDRGQCMVGSKIS